MEYKKNMNGVINIERMYSNKENITGVTAELPIDVSKLLMKLSKEGYFKGLDGFGDEEIIGALVCAGICCTVPENKWRKAILTYEE